MTTLAGEETQLTVDLQEHNDLQEFENAVLEQLPELGTSSTFCCELDFVCRNSEKPKPFESPFEPVTEYTHTRSRILQGYGVCK